MFGFDFFNRKEWFIIVCFIVFCCAMSYWSEANTFRSFTPADRLNQIMERQVNMIERIAVALEKIAEKNVQNTRQYPPKKTINR